MLGEDLLSGADKIAVFMYNDKKKRRSVYHLSDTTDIPIFRVGSQLCARKSQIIAWIEEQEAKQRGRPSRADAAAS